MELKEMKWEVVKWIPLAQNKIQLWDSLGSIKGGKFLNS
jgi:hypothetical protein